MLKAFFTRFFGTKNRTCINDLQCEIKHNFEQTFVVEQQGFISKKFSDQVIGQLCLDDQSDAIKDYAEVIIGFNQALDDMSEFESLYLSGPETKTLANAKVLHAKKEALDEMVKGIRIKIIETGKVVNVVS